MELVAPDITEHDQIEKVNLRAYRQDGRVCASPHRISVQRPMVQVVRETMYYTRDHTLIPTIV